MPYDSNVLQLERQGQNTKFVLDKGAEQYTVQTSSPQTAEVMFSDTDNRTQMLKNVCATLQERMYQLGLKDDVNGQRTFTILNQNGKTLESEKNINMTKLGATLEKYELSKVEYTVPNESGNIEAECTIESKQPDDMKVEFY